MRGSLRLLAVGMLLSGFALGGELAGDGTSAGGQPEVRISGEYIRDVNIAFDDYVRQKKGNGYSQMSRDIRSYRFRVREGAGYVIVGIGYDRPRLFKEKNVLIVGGGAEYHIEKGTGKILEKLGTK